MEHHLGVRGTLDVSELSGIDREHEVPSQDAEVGDEAVVHKKPTATTEGVTVGLLDGRTDRGPDMCEKQRRLGVGSELAQIRVAPRGRDAVVDARAVARAVPAEAEAVAV